MASVVARSWGKGSGELVFDSTPVQDEKCAGNWLHGNVKIATNNELCV